MKSYIYLKNENPKKEDNEIAKFRSSTYMILNSEKFENFMQIKGRKSKFFLKHLKYNTKRRMSTGNPEANRKQGNLSRVKSAVNIKINPFYNSSLKINKDNNRIYDDNNYKNYNKENPFKKGLKILENNLSDNTKNKAKMNFFNHSNSIPSMVGLSSPQPCMIFDRINGQKNSNSINAKQEIKQSKIFSNRFNNIFLLKSKQAIDFFNKLNKITDISIQTNLIKKYTNPNINFKCWFNSKILNEIKIDSQVIKINRRNIKNEFLKNNSSLICPKVQIFPFFERKFSNKELTYKNPFSKSNYTNSKSHSNIIKI